MSPIKLFKSCTASVQLTWEIGQTLKIVAASALATGAAVPAAHAAPPTLEAAQTTVKSFCANTYLKGSQDWTLCVSQGTQGYVDFAEAYPNTDPSLREAFEKCQARFGTVGNWALAGWCARERARYFEELR